MFDNFIQVIPTFTEEEASTIISECTNNQLIRAEVFAQDGRSTHVSDHRTNSVMFIKPNDKCYKMVVSKINEAYTKYSRLVLDALPNEYLRMPMPMAQGSESVLETVQFLQYREGQEYGWHTDANYNIEKISAKRVMSVVTYLNNDFEGGKTEFVDKARKPPVGSSLFFPSNWIFSHRAQPVTKGTKYALVTWYHIFDA